MLFQGAIRFETRGIAPAEEFFYIDAVSGQIYVKRPLNTETATSYTVSIGKTTIGHTYSAQ